MLIEYNAGSRYQILRIMNEPVIPGVPAHDRHIKGIRVDDGKVLWIQYGEVIRIKHRQPPLQHPNHHRLLYALPQTGHAAASSPSQTVSSAHPATYP